MENWKILHASIWKHMINCKNIDHLWKLVETRKDINKHIEHVKTVRMRPRTRSWKLCKKTETCQNLTQLWHFYKDLEEPTETFRSNESLPKLEDSYRAFYSLDPAQPPPPAAARAQARENEFHWGQNPRPGGGGSSARSVWVESSSHRPGGRVLSH